MKVKLPSLQVLMFSHFLLQEKRDAHEGWANTGTFGKRASKLVHLSLFVSLSSSEGHYCTMV